MRWPFRGTFWGVLGGLFAAGCQSAAPTMPVHRPPSARVSQSVPVQQVHHTLPAPTVLGLNELLALARSQNPDLLAALARVGEAQGTMTQAGLYPNPTVGYSGNQINDGPGTAGQQGGFVAQEFVTAGKLRIAREAARHGVSAADWNAVSQWFDTAARVKAAYIEYVTAAAVQRESERMAELFAEALTRVEALAAGGKVETYDVTRLRVEQSQATNRVTAAQQRFTAAARMLAVAVGVSTLPAPVATNSLAEPIPVPGFDEAVACVGRSAAVLAASAEVEQAAAEVRQAEVKPVPNVSVMVMAAQDFVTREPMANVQVGVPLPLWDRNQGAIFAAKSRLAATTAGVEQARLRSVERLTTAYQKYDTAQRQLERYQTQILPNAAAALEQIDRVYAVKPERFFDTLDARRVLAQARIDYAQTLGDLWTAAVEIEAVVQSQQPAPR